jgi:hypothetical protein
MQQSLENGRKMIGVQEQILTNFVITSKNACNYAQPFFTLDGKGKKRELKRK